MFGKIVLLITPLFFLSVFIFSNLQPTHASHGPSEVGKTYCDRNVSPPMAYINGPPGVHSPLGFSCEARDIIGELAPKGPALAIGYGAAGIKNLVTTLIKIAYLIAAVVFVFMIVFSAYQFLTSGGDKENLANARKRLTWAIVGITLLALTFFLLRVIGDILNFKFFT